MAVPLSGTPPRVLVVHNAYRSANPSGENVAVEREVTALRQAGWSIDVLQTGSDDLVGRQSSLLQRARAAPRAVWNWSLAALLGERVEAFRPDVVHLHNDFPQLGPAIHVLLRRLGTPYVQSIHNYRFACVDASFFRDGEECRLCLGRSFPSPGIRYRCGSGLARSTYVAGWIFSNGRARQTSDPVLAAPSRHVADALVEHGADPAMVAVRPNLAPPRPAGLVPASQRTGVVVAGRLDLAKGIHSFARAWAHQPPSGNTLHVFGDGALRGPMRELAEGSPSVVFHGQVPSSAVAAAMASARLVVVPSVWQEPFGLVALESLTVGTPVVVTGTGGLPDIVSGVTPELVVADPDPSRMLARVHWALDAELPSPAQLADHAQDAFGHATFVERTRQLHLMAMGIGASGA